MRALHQMAAPRLAAAPRRRRVPTPVGAPASARMRMRDGLTPREHEILSLLVGGHSYAAVGTGLAISLSTVQSHIKSIYRKLDVSSKAEAVGVALIEGILPRAGARAPRVRPCPYCLV